MTPVTPTPATAVTVFLVDDHEMVRRGVADLLRAEPDIEIVGEAGSAAEARARIPATAPQVVLLDVQLPDGSGIDVCRDLLESSTNSRCIILTGFDDDEAIYAAVIAGAAGYVLKSVRGNGLIESVRAVALGRSLLDPALTKRVTDRLRDAEQGDPRLRELNARERDVLTLIADGLTNRQIGARLSLAEKTVKNYVSSLLSKLGLQSRTQAAVLSLDTKPPTKK
jgi:two-component system, NarL family, response regulator DevR